jgi:HAE1 family hydrophobic/amphiphilic exporter-1
VLSLLLVPVVYEFIDDFEKWLMPRIGRLVTPREDPRPLTAEPRRAAE